MSDEVVISVEDLWKKYRLGVLGTGTIRHDFNRWWHRVRGKGDPYAKIGAADAKREERREKRAGGPSPGGGTPSPLSSLPSPCLSLSDDEVWALRGVSFEVKRGEILGIIGRNGAGKSTLLKILSRVTAPTSGEIRVKGRIASLLEVGTGFHPELTGRENIFLNGAILGMTKAEIKKKLDEIIAFAEIEKYIDTPVKRYSSGMYVRLAFAVAAHLEPEILIIDEVLAVGDAEFQKKCLGKMSEVAQGGRTILFVSHNLAAVQSLCKTGILLEGGQLKCAGSVQESVDAYSGKFAEQDEAVFHPRAGLPSITRVSLNPQALNNGDIELEISYESPFPLAPPVPGVVITSLAGVPVFGSNPRFHCHGFDSTARTSGLFRLTCRKLPLASATYRLSVWLGDWHSDYDQKTDALSFSFRKDKGTLLRPSAESIGHLDWPGEWKVGGPPQILQTHTTIESCDSP